MTDHSSPFSYLSNLRTLQLELSDNNPGAEKHWEPAPLLEPISCMTKLCSLTVLMQSSYCTWDIQHLSQLSHLTSLGIANLEQGLSTLVKLQHLSVRATEPPARCWMRLNPRTPDLLASLVTLTGLSTLDCGRIQYCQVSTLTLLTALKSLSMSMARDPFDHHASTTSWSTLSKLPILNTLDVSEAVLDAQHFQIVASMTQLTKLYFCGFSVDLHFSAEDLNKLSALTSLQYLHLEFIHSGIWSQALYDLDIHLKALLQSTTMQYFQVFDNECDSGGELYGEASLQREEEDDSLAGWDSESEIDSDSYHSDEQSDSE